MDNKHESLSETSANAFNLHLEDPFVAGEQNADGYFGKWLLTFFWPSGFLGQSQWAIDGLILPVG